jgi:hypothetical protein
LVHPGKGAAILIDEEASDARPNWVGVLSTYSRRAYRLKTASAGARDRPKAATAPLREQIESLSWFTVLALRAFSHDFVNQASKPDVPRLAIEPLMPELGDFNSLEPKWTVGNFEA